MKNKQDLNAIAIGQDYLTQTDLGSRLLQISSSITCVFEVSITTCNTKLRSRKDHTENTMRLKYAVALILISLSFSSTAEYSRSEWRHWKDYDRDCQNTRAEVLIRDSIKAVTFRKNKTCVIDTGQWYLPYSGDLSFSARDIDIDHVIPLKWASDHGGQSWNKDKKEAFANDPENLLSTKSSANRSMGAKGPEEWRPTINQCQYAIQWKYLLWNYDLTAPEGTQIA